MSNYKKYRKELIRELGNVCDKKDCNETENLQFHHINPEDSHPAGIGGWNHIFEVKNDIKNGIKVVLLCEKHHRKEHRKKDFKNKV